MDDDIWLAVTLPFDNPFLNEDGVERYRDFINKAHGELEASNVGNFEGAFISTSFVNLSFTLVPTVDAEVAVAIIIRLLRHFGYEQRATVEHGGFQTREGNHFHFENVVWPQSSWCNEMHRA